MVFNLFKKKKKVREIQIRDIEEWIKKTLEQKNLGLKTGILKRELNSKKIRIRELLEELKNAELKDERVVPERAKNMFEGNKNAYVQKVNVFLNEINFPEDISKLEDFLEDVSLKLEELAKETNKNFFIIKEFAEDQARSVANKLKEIDKLISEARANMEKTSLGKFKELKKLLVEYHESVDHVNETKKLLEEILEKKAFEIERRKKIELKIASLKNSSQHEDYLKLKNKKESLEEDIKQTEYTIINLFSGISSVLKKFYKKKKNKLAKDYSDNAVDALVKDDKYRIVKILEKVIKEKDSLDVKDSKLKKLDSEINAISVKVLDKLRKTLLASKSDLNDLNNRLKNHSFYLNLMEQEGFRSGIDDNIKDLESQEEEIENVLERTNPRLIKQKMKKVIKEIDEYTELI